MGLTGVIVSVTLQLLAIRSSEIVQRTLKLPDIFQDQDKPEAMYVTAGLDADAIAAAAALALGRGVNEARA